MSAKMRSTTGFILMSGLGLILSLGGGCAHAPRSQEMPIGPLPANSFARQWVADLQLTNNAVDHIYVRGDLVFAYTRSHQSFVLGRSGGELRHVTDVTSARNVLFPPVVLNQRIIYPTATTLEVYNLQGERQRTVSLDSTILSPAVGAGNRLYVGTAHAGGGRLLALDLNAESAATPVWQVMTPGSTITASPAMYDNVVYFAARSGRGYAVTEQRQSLWEEAGILLAPGGSIVADVQVDKDGVYFACTDSKLYSVDRTSGRIQWIFFAQQPLQATPAVTADLVYQLVPEVGIVAIDKAKGTYNRQPRWIAYRTRKFLGSDQRYAYLLDADNHIAAVDKDTGDIRFRSRRTDFVVFATNLTPDGMIFAASRDGKVYAIRPVLEGGQTGELVLAPQAARSVARFALAQTR